MLTVRVKRSTYFFDPKLESLCNHSSKLETDELSKSVVFHLLSIVSSPKKYSFSSLFRDEFDTRLEILAAEEDGKLFWQLLITCNNTYG